MRFFLFWIVAFESTMITSSTAYTYWVDASCSNRNNWNDYLTEARDMAAKANTRLHSSTDSDYANVFKRVFKVDKTDKNAFDTVTKILDGIGGNWTPGDRKASDMRIYCDNDKHWVAKKHKDGPLYFDEDNMMVNPFKGCSGTAEMEGSDLKPNAYTYQVPLSTSEQNPNRRVMMLCDKIFERQNAPKKLDDLPKNADLTKLNSVEDLKILISMTILHEWTHSEPYKRKDVKEGSSYGWRNIMALTSADSLLNADNYNHFALLALLAERGTSPGSGFTLPRPWSDPSSTRGQRAENDAKAGKLQLYKTITKRWLRQLAQHFRA